MKSQQQLHQLDRIQDSGHQSVLGNELLRCADLIQSLDKRATKVPVHKNRSLVLDQIEAENIYLVLDGMLVLDCVPAEQRRRIIRLFYPGDVIRGSFAPPLPRTKLSAVISSEVLRSNWNNFENLISTEKTVSDHYHRQIANQEARLGLHASVLGGLAAEARVASLLIELALRIGQPSGRGMSFDLPLSRSDMADYLALNADTLSRIFSRLKANGVFTQSGRRRVFVHNWQELLDESPYAPALVALHGS